MSRKRRPNPEDLSPREVVKRYLKRRRADATDASVDSWEYRLKLFVEWCEGIGIERVGELQAFDIDEYYDIRSGKIRPSTLEAEMWTLKKFVEYLEQLGAVENLTDAVRIPDVDEDDRSDETLLEESPALKLIDHYRNDDRLRATRRHAFLEIAWHTGARMGGIRALDLRDANLDENYLEFQHRPGTDTPLKNKRRGERPVAIPSEVSDVLREYIHGDRHDVYDDHNRQPLLASMRGRPGTDTIRTWSYLATLPCYYCPCPHGRERDECKMTEFAHSSKCPSSRSPHQIRTGSITWQLNIGIPPEVVSERVNAGLDVIERHYDKESPLERMERRRRQYVERMGVDL
ncbi:tyrosine-type recombinase/integrase [Haladaptatus sp. DYF46]|uniref:tyrosine-type recombinase/integrase n=1 Tax=Haladaptatus sp. DYF46 TaxID=2886041 RepID=UPI001E33D044|nr:tyrosine-type recombinase/integrase [Haladaptatus sp. DYF46]